MNGFSYRHVDVSDCGRYLIVCPQEDCRDNLLYFADLSKLSKDTGISAKLDLTQVVYKFSHDYEARIQYILNVILNVINGWVEW